MTEDVRPRLEYSDEVEKLVSLLEDQGATPGWEGSLPEIVIDYLTEDLSPFDLIHRYKCKPGRATRILSILNNATGRKSRLTDDSEEWLKPRKKKVSMAAFWYQATISPGAVRNENDDGFMEVMDYAPPSALDSEATKRAQDEFAEDENLMAGYIWDKDNRLKGKIDTIDSPNIRINNQGQVITTFSVRANVELTPEDQEALKGYILGQCSDGWGEDFEQHYFRIQDEDIEDQTDDYYISTWTEKAEVELKSQGQTQASKLAKIASTLLDRGEIKLAADVLDLEEEFYNQEKTKSDPPLIITQADEQAVRDFVRGKKTYMMFYYKDSDEDEVTVSPYLNPATMGRSLTAIAFVHAQTAKMAMPLFPAEETVVGKGGWALGPTEVKPSKIPLWMSYFER